MKADRLRSILTNAVIAAVGMIVLNTAIDEVLSTFHTFIGYTLVYSYLDIRSRMDEINRRLRDAAGHLLDEEEDQLDVC